MWNIRSHGVSEDKRRYLHGGVIGHIATPKPQPVGPWALLPQISAALMNLQGTKNPCTLVLGSWKSASFPTIMRCAKGH